MLASSKGEGVASQVTRRCFLNRTGLGLGAIAASLLLKAGDARGSEGSLGLAPRQSPRPERVKSVILMMQNGGPSQMDMFDPKPVLQKLCLNSSSGRGSFFRSIRT